MARMPRKPYTSEEQAVFKNFAQLHREDKKEWPWSRCVQELQRKIPGRSFQGLRTTWFVYLRSGGFTRRGEARKKATLRGKIRRGSRLYTPDGLKRARQAGYARIASMKGRLLQLGLTEDQISYALSASSARFTKEQIGTIEDWVTRHKSVSIGFFVDEKNPKKIGIKWASGEQAAEQVAPAVDVDRYQLR